MLDKICRVCGETNDLETLVSRDHFLGTKKKYPYLFCNSCRSLSIKTVPSDLNELYTNYYSFSSPPKPSKIKLQLYKLVLNNKSICSKITSYFLKEQDDLPILSLRKTRIKPHFKILDVGCGSGSLVLLLHKLGYKNTLGIDPYLEKDIVCFNKLKIKKKDFFDVKENFDIIMFNHVFEHVQDPKQTILHISKILKDNGVCIIRLPNVDSYSFLRYKENWFSIHAPFHLFLPSAIGMKQIISGTDLKLESIVGEQLIEFFLYSMGHELGVSDYDEHGNRKFIEKYGVKNIPPLHIKNEIKIARQRKKQVKKYNLCDWSIFYIRKK